MAECSDGDYSAPISTWKNTSARTLSYPPTNSSFFSPHMGSDLAWHFADALLELVMGQISPDLPPEETVKQMSHALPCFDRLYRVSIQWKSDELGEALDTAEKRLEAHIQLATMRTKQDPSKSIEASEVSICASEYPQLSAPTLSSEATRTSAHSVQIVRVADYKLGWACHSKLPSE